MHLGEQVCGCGADNNKISLTRQLDMPHLGLILEVEQVGINLVLG